MGKKNKQTQKRNALPSGINRDNAFALQTLFEEPLFEKNGDGNAIKSKEVYNKDGTMREKYKDMGYDKNFE